MKTKTIIAALGFALGAAIAQPAGAQEVLPFPPTPSASTAGLQMRDSIFRSEDQNHNSCPRFRAGRGNRATGRGPRSPALPTHAVRLDCGVDNERLHLQEAR